MKYGERLRTARERLKWSQGRLALEIGEVCSQENISKLERGDATGSEFTVHFAKALKIRPEWLAMEDGQMELDSRSAALVQLFNATDERGRDNIYRVAQQESIYSVSDQEQEGRSSAQAGK